LALFSSLATEARRPHLFFPAPKPKEISSALEQSQNYRLSFAEALPRTAETRLIFRLAAKPGAF
jgi:hypothetical protein